MAVLVIDQTFVDKAFYKDDYFVYSNIKLGSDGGPPEYIKDGLYHIIYLKSASEAYANKTIYVPLDIWPDVVKAIEAYNREHSA